MILLGITPEAIAGHSTAQDLAIEAAAGFDRTTPDNVMYKPVLEERILDDAILKSVPEARLMSVGASEPGRVATLIQESDGKLFLAMDNCPNQIVICAAPDVIEHARVPLSDEGALCQFLPFDRGYHTPIYQPVCDQIERATTSSKERIPKIPVYCTTTGEQLYGAAPEIRRIMIDQWASPIRFR